MHTCHTCSVQFSTFDAQKAHMKTDWHRYNCKRKVESLSGITFEEFSQKLANATPALTQAPNKSSHKSSNRSAVRSDLKDGLKENKMEEIITISEKDCLFCTRSFKNENDNLTHMKNDHGFFIPDYEYLVDLKGMLNYLGLKISKYFVCLYCNGTGKSFHSVSSTRHHMVSKGHCKIRYEADEHFEEFEDFYDFDLKTVGSDDSWEEISSVGSSQGLSQSLESELGHQAVGPTITSDFSQLILPSGVRVGHRSLQLYYRQSLKTSKFGSTKPMLSRQEREIVSYKQESSKKLMQNHINFRLKMGIKGNNQKHHRDTLGYST